MNRSYPRTLLARWTSLDQSGDDLQREDHDDRREVEHPDGRDDSARRTEHWLGDRVEHAEDLRHHAAGLEREVAEQDPPDDAERVQPDDLVENRQESVVLSQAPLLL